MNKKDLMEFLKNLKKTGQKISCLTSYDYPSARLLDEAGIDLILVGDSLGMVVLGHPDTTQVTLNDIQHHLKAVRRGATRSIVAADLPINTFDTVPKAVESSQILSAAGADMIKLEGALCPQIKAIVKEGIPVIAHLGMLCQQILIEKQYRIKGKTPEEAKRLLREAHEIQEAGASAVVLELVSPPVAQQITQELEIPTIGIGSGIHCDGQILVWTDLLGLQPWFRPSFVTPKADLASSIQKAVKEYINDVKTNHGE
ncbi:MAG: 3-methyl-2-oxobutanoate hydroxymethyltransferase [Alphaproteobacteria bacterium]|nr:3-methyl-2-oxobutanoate hydroxymethyltransferase [Chthoniobacterales bacterium]MBY0463126.1 3-methyl-2-oxobutanoate hydroxymethyltransferase [Alphaproteobacteria bacterium]